MARWRAACCCFVFFTFFPIPLPANRLERADSSGEEMARRWIKFGIVVLRSQSAACSSCVDHHLLWSSCVHGWLIATGGEPFLGKVVFVEGIRGVLILSLPPPSLPTSVMKSINASFSVQKDGIDPGADLVHRLRVCFPE